jgi:hypothetical protein
MPGFDNQGLTSPTDGSASLAASVACFRSFDR